MSVLCCAQQCPTLCDPMVCSPTGSSIDGILQARILEWVAIFFSGGLPDPGIKPVSLKTPNYFASGFFTTEPPGKPHLCLSLVQFSSFQLLSGVRLFATPWITARQASLSITNSQSSLKLTSIESVMPFSHLILCRPLLLLPPIPPSIRIFSNDSTLCMRWPKYWSYRDRKSVV